MRYKPYTPEEDDYIYTHQHEGAKAIAAALGRPWTSIYKRANKLKINVSLRQPWCSVHNQILLKYYDRLGAKDCAKILGRTPEAIHTQMCQLRRKQIEP